MQIPSSPRWFFLKVALIVTSFFTLSSRVGVSDDSKDRARSTQRALKEARESLHEAQRELAAKAERIAELEAQLKVVEEQRPAPKKEGKPVSKKEGKPEVRKDPAPMAGMDRGKGKPGEAAKPAAPRESSFIVKYDRNTAANYEGREAALKWMRERLKEKEGAQGFHIVGSANDSEYLDVNDEIAANRARYLADFLKMNGIPAAVIFSVSGKRSSDGEANGRRCVISSVVEKPSKEKGASN